MTQSDGHPLTMTWSPQAAGVLFPAPGVRSKPGGGLMSTGEVAVFSVGLTSVCTPIECTCCDASDMDAAMEGARLSQSSTSATRYINNGYMLQL